MINTITASFLSIILVSLVSLVGVFTLYLKQDTLKKYIFVFVSLALGALLGDAFLHLIPESFENLEPTLASMLVIAGIFLFFILEKFLHWHHHEVDEENHDHSHHHVGKMILVSDGLHNILDGAIIAASYLVSIPVGVATTIAVLLHEIPQEIGDFGVLLHSGYSKKRALFLNFVSALLAVVGGAIVLLFGSVTDKLIPIVVPIAAGGFIYIAMADLMPEIHKPGRKKMVILETFMAILGVVCMYLLLFLE